MPVPEDPIVYRRRGDRVEGSSLKGAGITECLGIRTPRSELRGGKRIYRRDMGKGGGNGESTYGICVRRTSPGICECGRWSGKTDGTVDDWSTTTIKHKGRVMDDVGGTACDARRAVNLIIAGAWPFRRHRKRICQVPDAVGYQILSCVWRKMYSGRWMW
jgi:hypothetical protein